MTLPSLSSINTSPPNGPVTNGSRPSSGVNGLLQGDVIFDRKFDVYPTKGWDVWTKSRNANYIDMAPSQKQQRQQQRQQQQQPQQQPQPQQGGNNVVVATTASPRGSGFGLPTMPTMFGGKQQQQVHPYTPIHTHVHTYTNIFI